MSSGHTLAEVRRLEIRDDRVDIQVRPNSQNRAARRRSPSPHLEPVPAARLGDDRGVLGSAVGIDFHILQRQAKELIAEQATCTSERQ